MKILYLSHVDWRWIKQRPQFIAEELAKHGATVTVNYLPAWRRGVKVKSPTFLKPRPMPHLPPATDGIRWGVNPWLRRVWLSRTCTEPDVVWVTHPSLTESIPHKWRDRIVYDAMDIVTEFGPRDPRLERAEERLLALAIAAFASSTRIKAHLESYRAFPPVVVARNALDGALPWPALTGLRGPASGYVAYCGTISNWFDVDALAALRAADPTIPVKLVGPAEPQLKDKLLTLGVELLGPLPHSEAFKIMCDAEILIMPFKVTPLVEAVDPVKLYEYVASGATPISVWYPELEHFIGLVDFYKNPDEFAQLVVAALGKARPLADLEGFCRASTWSDRASGMLQVLQSTERRGHPEGPEPVNRS